jgi:hypothetical protein
MRTGNARVDDRRRSSAARIASGRGEPASSNRYAAPGRNDPSSRVGDSGGIGWNVTQLLPTANVPGTRWPASSTSVTESVVTLSGWIGAEK